MRTPTKVCFEGLSVGITFACMTFVIYQSAYCFEKFLRQPKITNIDIENAFDHPYPSITICYDKTDFYEDTLVQCNLTNDLYYKGNIWIGNGTKSFCEDPRLLYEEMTQGEVIFDQIELTDQNSNVIVYDGTEENFQFKDDD